MRYAALTARALAKLPVLMELASPLLKRGGILICYKAQMEESELAHARRVQKLTGMELVGMRTLTLGEDYTRKIVTFEKNGTPTMKLPRRRRVTFSPFVKTMHQRHHLSQQGTIPT